MGSGRGGLAGQGRVPLIVAVSRALTEADLPAISNPPPVAAGVISGPQNLRHSHHRLAQLIAEGKTGAEVHLVTGYSQSYLSTLQTCPAFAELVEHYSAQRGSIFVDAQERLRVLGLDATEKLHEALHDPTQTWSKRELMEVVQMTVAEPKGSRNQVQPGAPVSGPAVQVVFVGAQPTSGTVTIDGKAVETKPGD